MQQSAQASQAPQTLTRPGQGQQVFTGDWRVLINGEQVYQFGGIGNNQGDANRVGRDWVLQQVRQGTLNPANGADIEVLPVMGPCIMRAKEFIVEYKTEEYNGLRFTTDIKNGQLIVRALDDWGTNELGHVVFNIGDQDELDPQDLEVDDRYQGQGIAKTMYDYVKTLGYEIHRSWDQTPAGAGFWNKHRGEDRACVGRCGQGAAGIILYAEDTGRYGLQQRSDDINDPGMWAAWGGGGESRACERRC
jgi:GNAT superfamily N-acetyltransferase